MLCLRGEGKVFCLFWKKLLIEENVKKSGSFVLLMLQKEIIVLGDVEMGAGNLTDDFISDQALAELILELAERPHPVDLVFNGDTFDFLKCPFLEKGGKLVYPRHITREISLGKLELIYQAHTKVFLALKRFLGRQDKRCFFIVGNHDFDLVSKAVKEKLKKILGHSLQVHFLGRKYESSGVYAEHGQQHDFLNRLNLRRLFLRYRGETILNIPFVSLGLISQMMKVKEEHPFLERIYPRTLLFQIHPQTVKKLTLHSAAYLLKSTLYYPGRYFFDPTYTFPTGLFHEFYRRVKAVHWDVDEVLHSFKKEWSGGLKKNKIYVLGHVHKKLVEDKDGVVIIHPGSWRDEYELDEKTRTLTALPKRYVQVLVHADGRLEHQLIELPVKRNQFDFGRVIKNEREHVQLAAREEGFKQRFVG